MELIFNPCGEFRWSPEHPVSQISHSSPPHWCPWDLFQIYKVCSDAKERVGCRKQREATTPIQSLVKLQPWFLSLRWKTSLQQNCSLGSCACSEGPALGQNTWWWWLMSKFQNILCTLGFKVKHSKIFCNSFRRCIIIWQLRGPAHYWSNPHRHVIVDFDVICSVFR